MTGGIQALRVLADNPAVVDLLGLRPVARAVADIVCVNNGEPITVGLHGPWGSGKSSLLEQIRVELSDRDKTLIVDLNPWEFDDQDDVKGTIIGSVLDALIKKADPDLKERLVGLMRRISWSRAAKAVAKGALTMSWDFNELADALTPREQDGHPTTLAGFRVEFEKVMADVPFDRVVLLIDDLDRCLPTAVLATLEAVKLFLAVPKMAFVVAADQEMVRDAIASGLGETRRSALFARDYLDKIVQVPIGVPQPTQDDAECYVALLLAHRDVGTEIDLGVMAQHAESRRATGHPPYLGESGSAHITPTLLNHARLIVTGLGVDEVVNPRRLKRFVNALAVRHHTAEASGVALDSGVIAKLFMLEHRFPKQMRTLAATKQVERDELLQAWEAWADGGHGGATPGDPEDELKVFLGAEPRLAGADTEKYFVLARKLMNVRASSALSEAATECLHLLLSDDAMLAERGANACAALSPEAAESVVLELVAQLPTTAEPNRHLQALIRAGAIGTSPEQAADALRSRRAEISPGTAALLEGVPDGLLRSLANELGSDSRVPADARTILTRSR